MLCPRCSAVPGAPCVPGAHSCVLCPRCTANKQEFSRDTFNLQTELKDDIAYERKRLELAVDAAQPIYDAAKHQANAVLSLTTNLAFSTLISERQAIHEEIAAAVDPLLDKLARNAVALKKHDRGVAPDIGPRPAMPRPADPTQGADWNAASPQAPQTLVVTQ